MAGEKDELWPLWLEPATKGDVVTALVATRACIIDIYLCLRALEQNDPAKLKRALEALNKNDDKLGDMIDRIGGGAPER